ncbi:MAG: VWA domain-containing protein [Myxococcota bacterium]
MGYGMYSIDAHRALTTSRAKAPREAVFRQRKCHPLMDPKGLRVRESRDSEAHPHSLGIVLALDVTGSMGQIPHDLATRDLPAFVGLLEQIRVEDPQVLFMAVGDATSDRAPLQVGQFESEAGLMDQWLTSSFLEGGGGGSFQESYELAMYVAARHTSMDCWEKRRRRGYFFLTGDELPYAGVSRIEVERLIGDELADDVPIERIVDELSVAYEPFFLIPDLSRVQRCGGRWRELLGDQVIPLALPEDICPTAALVVALGQGAIADLSGAEAVLKKVGVTERRRVARILRALEPYAESPTRAAEAAE